MKSEDFDAAVVAIIATLLASRHGYGKPQKHFVEAREILLDAQFFIYPLEFPSVKPHEE